MRSLHVTISNLKKNPSNEKVEWCYYAVLPKDKYCSSSLLTPLTS